jgi:hypothetical protein
VRLLLFEALQQCFIPTRTETRVGAVFGEEPWSVKRPRLKENNLIVSTARTVVDVAIGER